MLDIDVATHEELIQEYEDCQKLWSLYSCDCFGFYISALHKAIVDKGEFIKL